VGVVGGGAAGTAAAAGEAEYPSYSLEPHPHGGGCPICFVTQSTVHWRRGGYCNECERQLKRDERAVPAADDVDDSMDSKGNEVGRGRPTNARRAINHVINVTMFLELE